MAKVYLDSTDTAFTVSNSGTTVYGNSGAQIVTIASGITGVTFDQNTESVVFAGATSDYTFKQATNKVIVYTANGTLVATIPTQGDTDGTQLTFTNGTVNAVLTGNTMKVGGVAITATAAAVTPTVIDTTVKSGSAAAAAPTFTLTAGVDTFTGTTSNEVWTANTKNFQADDTILDTSTTDSDTLNLNQAAVDTAVAATINNVENINYNYSGVVGASFTATNVKGATITANLTQVATDGALTLTGLGDNNAVAGTNVSSVTVTGLKGGTVDLGSATTADITSAAVATTSPNVAVANLKINGDVTDAKINVATVGTVSAVTIVEATKDAKLTLNAASTLGAAGINDSFNAVGAGKLTLSAASNQLGTLEVIRVNTLELTGNGKTSLDLGKSTITTINDNETASSTLTISKIKSGVTVNVNSETATDIITGASGASTETITVNLNKDNATLTLASLAGAAITASAATKTITSLTYSGNDTLAINGNLAVTTLEDNDAVADKLTISGTGNVTVGTGSADVSNVDASAVTGVLTLTNKTATKAVTVVGASGSDALTFINTEGNVNANTGTGDDTVTLSGAYTGNATVALGEGKNTATFASTTGNATVTAGAGDDTITFSALAAGKTNVSLGDGTNKLTYTAAYVSVANTITGGAGVDTIDIAEGTLTSASVLAATLGAGDDIVKLGSGTTVVNNAASKISVDFGDGSDTLQLIEAADLSTTLTTGNVTFTNLETIAITGTTTTGIKMSQALMDGASYALKGVANQTNDKMTVIADLKDTTLDLSKLTIDSTFDGIAYNASSQTEAMTITGSAGVDTLTIKGGIANSVSAGAANDSIVFTTAATGVNAKATIDGGTGTDTLTFAAADTTLVDADFAHITGVEKIINLSTTGMSFTSGTNFNTNFATSGVTLTADALTSAATVAMNTFTGAATLAITDTTSGTTNASNISDHISIATGSGADTVTVTATGFTGDTKVTSGTLTVATGSGNDTINLSLGTSALANAATGIITNTGIVMVNAGTGADTISVGTHLNASAAGLGTVAYKIADGDSIAASFDKIYGFDVGSATVTTSISDILDLEGTAAVAAAVTSSDAGTASDGATNVGSFKSHTIAATGMVTFGDYDANDSSYNHVVQVNALNLSDALAYVAANVTGNGNTVIFQYDRNNDGTVDSTIVFEQGASDTVVDLVGVLGLSIGANAATDGLIAIA